MTATSPSEVMSRVAGYSVYNDASIRQYQFHAKQIVTTALTPLEGTTVLDLSRILAGP